MVSHDQRIRSKVGPSPHAPRPRRPRSTSAHTGALVNVLRPHFPFGIIVETPTLPFLTFYTVVTWSRSLSWDPVRDDVVVLSKYMYVLVLRAILEALPSGSPFCIAA